MRLALVLLLVNGLVPGLSEVVEALTHYVTEGHLAHSDADHGDLGHQGDEHGCGTTEHHCSCCASQELGPAAAGPAPALAPIARRVGDADRSLSGRPAPAPPWRPPIAS